MSITVKDFPDLIQIINAHPEWRERLRKALFPDIDLSKSLRDLHRSLRELAEEQKLTQQALRGLTGRVDGLETRVERGFDEASKERQHINVRLDEASRDRRRIEARMDKGFKSVKRDMGVLKGDSYESGIQNNAAAIFGICIRRGKNARESISEQLYEALETGAISEDELVQVMAADLLWGGKGRTAGRDIVLVTEVSWYAEEGDLKRAVERAGILASIGVEALPVVAGKEWAEGLPEQAIERGAVIVRDKRVDRTSWQKAGERGLERQD